MQLAPRRAKLCSGPCGLVKALWVYPLTGRGYPDSLCRSCKSERERVQRQSRPGVKEGARRAWKKAYRGQFRARKLAYFKARRRRLAA